MASEKITEESPLKPIIIAAIREHVGLPDGVGRVNSVTYDAETNRAQANVVHANLGAFRKQAIKEVQEGIKISALSA